MHYASCFILFLLLESVNSKVLLRKRRESIVSIPLEENPNLYVGKQYDSLSYDDLDLVRLMQGIDSSMSMPTTSPPTATEPSTQPPTVTNQNSCDPACPCCTEIPEFARAIEAYSVNKCEGGSDSCCLSRQDGSSDLILLVECESEITPGYNVAYMSYDYSGVRNGCTAGETCKMCGDSAFNDPLWIVLSDEEADACENLVQSRIQNKESCGTDWPC